MKENEVLQTILSVVMEMNTGFTNLQADVAELKTDVTELKTDVAELKTDVAELKTDVAMLKGEVKRLDEKIDVNYGLLEKFYVEQSEWNTAMNMRMEHMESRQLVYETQVQRNTYNIEQSLKKEKRKYECNLNLDQK